MYIHAAKIVKVSQTTIRPIKKLAKVSKQTIKKFKS
nr:MAG TPA: PURINE NUCLEOTIDE SYNTHESIS REPRESSOR/DNA Complex REGULATION, DNA-BINDING, REPRESSOR, PURINE [Caudoviricetes sp.]